MEPYQVVIFSVLPVAVGVLTLWYGRWAGGGDFRRAVAVERRAEQQRALLPMRLQAYERLTVFLERISPESLLVRTSCGGTNAEFQAALLASIRDEWHHNVSQQVYVSVEAWEAVKLSKARIVHIITQCGSKIHPDAPSLELSHMVLAALLAEGEHPTASALRLLQREVSHMYA